MEITRINLAIDEETSKSFHARSRRKNSWTRTRRNKRRKWLMQFFGKYFYLLLDPRILQSSRSFQPSEIIPFSWRMAPLVNIQQLPTIFNGAKKNGKTMKKTHERYRKIFESCIHEKQNDFPFSINHLDSLRPYIFATPCTFIPAVAAVEFYIYRFTDPRKHTHSQTTHIYQ